MIPNLKLRDVEVREDPSLSWAIDYTQEQIKGMAEGQRAVAQAIYLALNVERYAHEIYPWGYGVELLDLIGKSKDYVIPELKRRIVEALLVDDRVIAVDQFKFEWARSKVVVSFMVSTAYGDLQASKEVIV